MTYLLEKIEKLDIPRKLISMEEGITKLVYQKVEDALETTFEKVEQTYAGKRLRAEPSKQTEVKQI